MTCFIIAIILGIIIALLFYQFIWPCIQTNKSNYTPQRKSVKRYLQQDTSKMDFPITNNTGYRNPTIGLPIQPISTSSSITSEILAPSRAKSVMPGVQETIIYRGPMDQNINLPRPTFGAVTNQLYSNERALNSPHNIAGVN